MAHYLFNVVPGNAENGSALRELVTGSLAVGMWRVDAGEQQRDALAPGDLVLVYVGAPERVFMGCAELASVVHEWTPSETEADVGGSSSGVLLTHVEPWDPPVPMNAVLARIGPSENARADFSEGVVRITATEYQAAVTVAAGR